MVCAIVCLRRVRAWAEKEGQETYSYSLDVPSIAVVQFLNGGVGMAYIYVNHAVIRADNDPLISVSDCKLLYDTFLDLLGIVVDNLATLSVAIYPVTKIGDIKASFHQDSMSDSSFCPPRVNQLPRIDAILHTESLI